jgi:class 3 adenylate cyclase
MAWNEERSKKRVAENDFSEYEVNVADLSKTMDFHNLGTQDVRRVEGVHVYADVRNFHTAVEDAGADKTKQRKLLRAASVLRRVQGDLLDENEVEPIQHQSARLHCLNFKPYDDGTRRALQAVETAVTLNSYLYDVFNGVFADVRDFAGAIGIAAGTSYVANIGFRGDRELICLGTCANLGAKVINGRDTITITDEVYNLLPACLQEHFRKSRTVAGIATYQAEGLRWSRYADLADELCVEFNPERLTKTTEEYRDALPLSEMEISEAEALIDTETLTERNSKRTSAVAIFADLDGFTRYVQEADEDGKVVSLVRTLHMIRHEFHAIAEQDYPGLVLQHQGDRTFAIVHMPPGDNLQKRCGNALDVAIGIQSSMGHVLNERLGDRKDIHVAVGLDVGTTLVTRLGKKGRRVVMCLGPSVTSAERLQLRSAGRQIRISKAVYDTIGSELLREQFSDDENGAYVAEGLTFPRLDEMEEEQAARTGSLGAAVEAGRIAIKVSAGDQPRPWGNAKPWSSE